VSVRVTASSPPIPAICEAAVARTVFTSDADPVTPVASTVTTPDVSPLTVIKSAAFKLVSVIVTFSSAAAFVRLVKS
jgi:hypothetical protein